MFSLTMSCNDIISISKMESANPKVRLLLRNSPGVGPEPEEDAPKKFYYECYAYGCYAEFAEKYGEKDKTLIICGRVKDAYNKDGKTIIHIIADSFEVEYLNGDNLETMEDMNYNIETGRLCNGHKLDYKKDYVELAFGGDQEI